MIAAPALHAQLHRLGFTPVQDAVRGCVSLTVHTRYHDVEALLWPDPTDGDLLLLVPGWLKAPESAVRGVLAELLLALNFKLAAGCFELDPADGEVRFRLTLVLGDQAPDDAALQRALGALQYALDLAWGPCQRVLWAGATLEDALSGL